MIFGFIFISKKDKGELCRKNTIRFTLMLIRGTRDWRKKEARKKEKGSPLFITCWSECFNTTTVETATAMYLFRLKEPLT
jgi:hypothetical protein